MSDDYIELEGVIDGQTPKAVRFQADHWEEFEWLPRSQIELIQHPKLDSDGLERFTVKVKSWLAKKNGWTE